MADDIADEAQRCIAHNRGDRWEARSALLYGSRHEGYFTTEDEARAFAAKEIADAGGVGRIEAVIRRTVYFNRFEELY